jgi:hypothetical protein
VQADTAPPPPPPLAPTGLTAVVSYVKGKPQVTASWTELNGPVPSTQVQRMGSDGVWQPIATTYNGYNQWMDPYVQAGQTYGYRVRDITPLGTTGWSNVGTVTICGKKCS